MPALGATIPNDPYFKYQWPLYNDGSYSPVCYSTVKAGADMKTTLAWDIEQGDSNLVVAVIDGGCAMNHPEFVGRFWVNKGEIPGNGIDDDKNGYVDDVNGWNFYKNTNNLEDIDGHGTSIAGIIGANVNNGTGFAGIDWHCKLMILKVGDTLPHSLATASAIKYAMSNGARIINLSIGFDQESPSIKQAIIEASNKSVLIIVAAGNNALDSMEFPANIPEILAVGSTNPDDTWSRNFPQGTGGSIYGSNLGVVAPGNCVRYINPLAAAGREYNQIGSGTSISTVYVTGLAALLLAQNPTRTPAQIKRLITLSADDLVGNPAEDTPGWDKHYGWGRVNMYRALKADTTAIRQGKTLAVRRDQKRLAPELLFEHGSIMIQETHAMQNNRIVVRRWICGEG